MWYTGIIFNSFETLFIDQICYLFMYYNLVSLRFHVIFYIFDQNLTHLQLRYESKIDAAVTETHLVRVSITWRRILKFYRKSLTLV